MIRNWFKANVVGGGLTGPWIWSGVWILASLRHGFGNERLVPAAKTPARKPLVPQMAKALPASLPSVIIEDAPALDGGLTFLRPVSE